MMKRSTFRNLVILVAIVAIIYSPSVIGFGAQSNALTTGELGLTHFVSYLKGAGYQVLVANSSSDLTSMLAQGRAAYFVIAPDTPLSQQEQQAVQSGFRSGNLSLLIGAGNTTDNALISPLGASVSGAPISDPTSSFKDQRIFDVGMTLGGSTITGVIDIASPLTLSSSFLSPVASSSPRSTDASNSTAGSRVVAASGTDSNGSRVFVITNSAPFTNQLMLPASGPNDTAFVQSIVSWVTASHLTDRIVLDNAHYKETNPGFHFGVPVGVIGVLLLQGFVASIAGPFGLVGGTGGFSLFGIPSVVFSLAFAFFALLLIRRIIKRYFAQEKVIRDDQPLPPVERTVVAESKERADFLSVSRSKSFYVAACAQLYDVLDEVSNLEFGGGLNSLTPEKLAAKVGAGDVTKTQAFLAELSRIYEYANGKRRLLLPPVLRWRHKVDVLTSQAEAFLNKMGMSISGEGQAKSIEYALKR